MGYLDDLRRSSPSVDVAEVERTRWRLQVGTGAGGERQAAADQCLVAQRIDAQAELGAQPRHRGAEDGDLVARRDAVRDLDGPDQLRGSGGAVEPVEGLVEAPPD